MSEGLGLPTPSHVAALQPEVMVLRGERGGAVGTALCPASASRLWCRALLLLVLCVSITALPCGLGTPPAVTWGPLGSSASQQGTGDNLVTAHGDLIASGLFPEVQGDMAHGTDAVGWSLGTPAVAPSVSRTSPQWQPGSGDREGLRVDTAAAVMLSPSQWLGTGVPATSTSLFQTKGDPSPGSWHHFAQGSLHGVGPDSHGATQMPAVTSAPGLGQPVGTAEPQSGSEGTPRDQSEPAAGVPATPQLWLQPPSLPAAASGPSAGAAVMEAVPTQLVPPQGAAGGSQAPSSVPALTLMDDPSWSHSTAQPVVPPALPVEGTSSSAKLYPGTAWVPSAMPAVPQNPTGVTFLCGKTAPVVDTSLAEVPGNGSGLLTLLPSTALAPGVHNPEVLSPFLPTAERGGPAVTSGEQSDLPSLPAQPMSTGARPSPAWTRAPSAAGTTVTGMSSTAPGASLEPGQVAVTEESRTAPAGPPEPTHASLGSVPLCSSASPALEHHLEPGHHTGTTSVPSPSYLPTSPGARHAASSLLNSRILSLPTGVPCDAQSVSSVSITSQNPSTATEHLPAATGEPFSPAGTRNMGQPGSSGMKPPASHPSRLPSPAQPVHVVPLQFRLLGIAYTPALGSRNSKSYRELEGDVTLMLHQMLSSYETFMQANVLEFMNGSVVVQVEVLFWGDAPAPTSSHIIRTVLTEASRGGSTFSWHLEPQSVQSGGFSLENLDPEKLSISLTGFQLGMSRMEPLERLVREVTSSVSPLYHVRNFTISELRNLYGNLEITGDLYLDTVVHADVTEVLQALATLPADLTSLSVEGSKLRLQMYPLSFLITNRHFSQKLRDPLTVEYQDLVRDLRDAVARALRDHATFLKVMIREFQPGSLICHANIMFHRPAPTSMEVLEALVLSIGPNQTLAGSDIQVDPFSVAVGEDTLEPPPPQPGFPVYGVVSMVVGGLCIIFAPIVLVCLGTRRLGQHSMTAHWDRRDLEVGIQTLEMDNQGFWAEDPEGDHICWQSTSA